MYTRYILYMIYERCMHVTYVRMLCVACFVLICLWRVWFRFERDATFSMLWAYIVCVFPIQCIFQWLDKLFVGILWGFERNEWRRSANDWLIGYFQVSKHRNNWFLGNYEKFIEIRKKCEKFRKIPKNPRKSGKIANNFLGTFWKCKKFLEIIKCGNPPFSPETSKNLVRSRRRKNALHPSSKNTAAYETNKENTHQNAKGKRENNKKKFNAFVLRCWYIFRSDGCTIDIAKW